MPPLSSRKPETVPTSYPHIVRTEGVCGGRPRIAGSRIAVSTIAGLFRQGESAQAIAASFPHLDPASVDEAIGYYLEHREEIEAEIRADSLDEALAQVGGILGEDGVVSFVNRIR